MDVNKKERILEGFGHASRSLKGQQQDIKAFRHMLIGLKTVQFFGPPCRLSRFYGPRRTLSRNPVRPTRLLGLVHSVRQYGQHDGMRCYTRK